MTITSKIGQYSYSIYVEEASLQMIAELVSVPANDNSPIFGKI